MVDAPTIMQGDVGSEIVARGDPPLSSPARRLSSRVVKPSSKVSEVRDTFENASTTTRRATNRGARATSTETELERLEEVKKNRGNGETGKSMLVRVLEELKQMKDALYQQREFMQQWQKQQSDREQQLHGLICDLRQDIADTKEELKQVKEQLEDAACQRKDSPFLDNTRASYADIVRNSENQQPASRLGRVRLLPSTSESLFCTVDISRLQAGEGVDFRPNEIRALVERKIRDELGTPDWRCQAVTAGLRSPHLIRVVCRDRAEHESIKRVLETNLPREARVLRDEYYQIKVDGVSRSSVLDEMGRNLPGVNETLSRENDTEVVKIGWLSDRLLKDYGSMVVYLKSADDATRFLREGYFYAGGLSGQVRAFERRQRPSQCYNCQEITNHKAYQCVKPQKCGRCAGEGHHHSTCTETEAKCIPCGGPHESFSKNCRRLYPSLHE